MPDENGTPLMSGSVYSEQVKIMEKIAGPEAVRRAILALSLEEQETLANLLPVSWFRVDTSNQLIINVASEVGRDPMELNRETTRLGVEHTLKTIWRVLLRFTTDHALITRCPVFYSKNYDGGDLTAKMTGPGAAEIVLSGWPTTPPDMDIDGIGTAVAEVLKCAGRRGVKLTWERRPDGAFYNARWNA